MATDVSFPSERLNRLDRLYLAARMYYLERRSQEDIARVLGVSRSRVSRLVREAWESGIVEVRLHRPMPRSCEELADALAGKYGLKCCVVADVPARPSGQPAEDVRHSIGRVAAQYLQATVKDGQLIGLGWGMTLYEMVNSLADVPRRQVTIVPLLGGVGQADPRYQVNDLAYRLAEAFGGTALYLHAPAYADTEAAAEAILQQRRVQQVVQLWSELDLALVGIGPPVPQSPVLEMGTFDETTLLELLRQKAAGDVCTHFFNVEGQPCRLSISRRFIGIPLDTLKSLPLVVGVAGGPHKVPAIRLALEGKYVSGLITDRLTAWSLLADQEILAEQREAGRGRG
ncbi:MAG: sugar-binding transcriptional regulator [Limnochordaceae bacterium]|nr:sugar-binding transcriptional regulator [Limnochordaceae bacterium]